MKLQPENWLSMNDLPQPVVVLLELSRTATGFFMPGPVFRRLAQLSEGLSPFSIRGFVHFRLTTYNEPRRWQQGLPRANQADG